MLIKHMAGNMCSRWTDFLTSDGVKPDRHRDQEFEIDAATTRVDVIEWWERGWQCVFQAITPLISDDLGRKVVIAGREHTVMQAITRQVGCTTRATSIRSFYSQSISVARRGSP